MKFSLTGRAAPLLLTTLLAAAPALAQTTAPTAPAAPTNPASPPAAIAPSVGAPSGTTQKAAPHPGRAANARQPGESRQSAVERHITEMRSKLHITDQQATQWDQFAQLMRDNAREMEQVYQQRAERIGSMSAVDNMQSFAQIEQQRAQEMQKLVPAFQSLYMALSEQQKKTADEMFRVQPAGARGRGQAAAK
ncbi:MAG: Spy/CpxP family protein refolding chaperone [Acetobacteraceae bacterium]